MQISSYVQQLAQQANGICGLDVNVILAQWMCEQTIQSANWPGNNPAGITAGNSNVDALSNGQSGGFLTFPTPAAGAQAYGVLYATDPNYAGVRAAIKTGSAVAEIQAIVNSPWDAGHYQEYGYNSLAKAYNEITGGNVTVVADTSSYGNTYPTTQNSATAINNQINFPPSDYGIVANSQKYGNILYGRRYRIIVSNSNGIALDVSDLHVSFDIKKTINQQPNYSTVLIYNLNPQTEDFILLEGDKVYIEAGYEGSQYGLIFTGDIMLPIRDKADNVTYRLTLYCLDSDRMLNQGFAAITVNRGQSARDLVQNITSKATIPTPLGFLSDKFSTQKLPRGKTVFGMTRDYLRQIAQTNNMAFYAENGQVNFIHATDLPQGEIYDLTPQTGLIGEPAQEDLGVAFRCLMNPSLQINSFVHIDNQYIQGQTFQIGDVPRNLDSAGIYRIISLEHSGDTRGTNWYTGCLTVSQAGGIPGSTSGAIPGMISTTTASPW